MLNVCHRGLRVGPCLSVQQLLTSWSLKGPFWLFDATKWKKWPRRLLWFSLSDQLEVLWRNSEISANSPNQKTTSFVVHVFVCWKRFEGLYEVVWCFIVCAFMVIKMHVWTLQQPISQKCIKNKSTNKGGETTKPGSVSSSSLPNNCNS